VHTTVPHGQKQQNDQQNTCGSAMRSAHDATHYGPLEETAGKIKHLK